MMELIFLRHGETDYNKDGMYQGQLDSLLNNTGKLMARETGKAYAHRRITKIYSSDLSRAEEVTKNNFEF